jgi:DNA repair exonuclease SbcCD nuclease subunit
VRLVHLSDLHLGFRQYQRLTPSGFNQREHDVARTFRRAVEKIIELRPELILVAGDVFHSSRPTNAAILDAFRQFVRIRNELPKTRIVMIAGDHDTPRTSESGNILQLFAQIDIDVAANDSRAITIPELDASILAVPDIPGMPMPQLSLDPADRRKYNVLLIHANVNEVVPQYYADLDRATNSVTRSDLQLSQWDYVALGHYHVHRMVAQNAYYSGSLDYTSLNVWFDKSEEEELGLAGKGFIEYDLGKKTMQYHTLEASRDFRQLKPIAARDMSPAEVDAAIRKAVEKVKGGIDDKVIRIVVKDIARQVSRELDHRALRDYKKRALNFILDFRRPEITRRETAGGPSRRPSVSDVVREQLTTRDIPSDLDRGRLVELGMKYLDDAETLQPATPAAASEVEG